MATIGLPFGRPDESTYFFSTYPIAPNAVDRLLDTAEKVFCRASSTGEPAARIGFFLGRICVEEFNEILLLSVNGYGIGAMKILRTMYERAVTAAYILKNFDLAMQFLEYNVVHKRKALNHLKKLFKVKQIVSDEMTAAIEAEFERLKDRYTEVVCEDCCKSRVQGSWTKRDLATLANDVGDQYADYYYDCYYQPTLQAHTTFASLESYLSADGEGLAFRDGPQREQARFALIHAHNLLLKVLETQDKFFGLGLSGELQDRTNEFILAYRSASQPAQQ